MRPPPEPWAALRAPPEAPPLRPQSACPVCGSTRWRDWATLTIRPETSFLWDLCLRQVLPYGEIRQDVRLCRACGGVFRSPVWDEAELERLYSPETWKLVEPYRPKTPRAFRNNELRRDWMGELILAHAPRRERGAPLAIADVGGRDGFYVAPFLERGWEVTSIDSASTSVVDPRLRRLAVRLDQAGLREAFDAVVLSHILEHLVGLADFLGQVRGALRPAGVVYAEVPYEVPRVLLGRDLGDPSHQIYFATRTLRYALESAGFTMRLCARRRSTYDLSELLAIVVIAVDEDAAGPPGRPPGMLHTLLEMASPVVLALALRNRLRPPA